MIVEVLSETLLGQVRCRGHRYLVGRHHGLAFQATVLVSDSISSWLLPMNFPLPKENIEHLPSEAADQKR